MSCERSPSGRRCSASFSLHSHRVYLLAAFRSFTVLLKKSPAAARENDVRDQPGTSDGPVRKIGHTNGILKILISCVVEAVNL